MFLVTSVSMLMIKTDILNGTTLKHYINNNKKNDLNVKIAAHTLSGSVADANEFFMLSSHPTFIQLLAGIGKPLIVPLLRYKIIMLVVTINST